MKHALFNFIFSFSLALLSFNVYAFETKNLLIDTDVGIDDAIAILYVFKAPEFKVSAITIEPTGNTHCKTGYANIQGLIKLGHYRRMAVACGSQHPLQGHHVFTKEV